MSDTDEYERTTPELEEFEGETLGDTLTNLLTEVQRLREGIGEIVIVINEDWWNVHKVYHMLKKLHTDGET